MKELLDIEPEIQDQIRPHLRCVAPRAAPAPPAPTPGVWIDGFALGDESPEELRRNFEAAYADYTPRTATEAALVDQAVVAQIEIERCHTIRGTIRTAKVRTALRDFDRAQDDEVDRLRHRLDGDPYWSVVGLKRFAAGVRFLIDRWERLGRHLEQDGTLLGVDRIEAIQLQGLSAMVEDLYISEQAWWTWVWCLAAQLDPKQRDIDLILDRRVMPKRVQDMDKPVWRPDPEECRAKLRALIAETLLALRPLADRLRTEYELPERAEAVQRALARADKDEQQLVRDLRGHERSLAQAHKALANR